jgi:hypothetical protein
LSYCSPARAGLHEVTVEAVRGEAYGRVTYEFDAAGFGPQCNPSAPPPFAIGTQRVGAGRRVRDRAPSVRARAARSSRGQASGTVVVGDDPEAGAQ